MGGDGLRKIFFFKIYLFLRERERACEGRREAGEREREPASSLPAQPRPGVGLDPRTPDEVMPELKSRLGGVTGPRWEQVS